MRVAAAVSAERERTNTTVVCCMGATGILKPPTFIVKPHVYTLKNIWSIPPLLNPNVHHNYGHLEDAKL